MTIRRSRTLTVRVTLPDYARLHALAVAEEVRLADLLRSYLSNGLRAEQQAPLEPVPWRGRPKRT